MKLIDKVKAATDIDDDNVLIMRCPDSYTEEKYSKLCEEREIFVPAFPEGEIHDICKECWDQEVGPL